MTDRIVLVVQWTTHAARQYWRLSISGRYDENFDCRMKNSGKPVQKIHYSVQIIYGEAHWNYRRGCPDAFFDCDRTVFISLPFPLSPPS